MKVYETYSPTSIQQTPPIINKYHQLYHILQQAKTYVHLKNYEEAQKLISVVLNSMNIDAIRNPIVIEFFRVLEFVDSQLKNGGFDPQRIINIIEKLSEPFNSK